jgi:ribosomal protein L11
VHPSANSYKVAAAKKQLSTTVIAERRKISKYTEMAKAARAEFFPFVVESFGGFGVKAAEFVDAFVAASKSSHSAWCPREIVYGVTRDVAIAVQRGNAAMAVRVLSGRE